MIDKEKKLYLASLIFLKNIDYEDFIYSDYATGLTEDELESIWNYVILISENGEQWFKEKFKEYKLYF